jgi:hypothetical protein
MSQVDAYTIPGSPLTMAQLAARLEALFAAAIAANRGATAPTDPQIGMLWWDTTLAPIEQLRVYRAVGWRNLLTLNVTTGELTWGSTVGIAQGGTGATTLAAAQDSLGMVKKTGDTMSAKLLISTNTTAGHNYAQGHLELQTSNGSSPSLGFHRSGFTACQLRHDDNGLVLSGTTQAAAANLTVTGNVTVTGNISGNLNASNLTSGTVPDARLSSNVALASATTITFNDSLQGTVYLWRAGNLVFANWDSMTHPSTSLHQTATGVIPSGWYPARQANNVYFGDQNRIDMVRVETNGRWTFFYSGVSRPTTGPGNVTWSLT